jgi:hypothetical protein
MLVRLGNLFHTVESPADGSFPRRANRRVRVGTQWDVTRDGKRLLMLKPVASDAAQVRQNQIVVVQNWTEELKRLVPTR